VKHPDLKLMIAALRRGLLIYRRPGEPASNIYAVTPRVYQWWING
jgi:hypothetical protein